MRVYLKCNKQRLDQCLWKHGSVKSNSSNIGSRRSFAANNNCRLCCDHSNIRWNHDILASEKMKLTAQRHGCINDNSTWEGSRQWIIIIDYLPRLFLERHTTNRVVEPVGPSWRYATPAVIAANLFSGNAWSVKRQMIALTPTSKKQMNGLCEKMVWGITLQARFV